MNGMKWIFQKEMHRVFRDRKMVFSLFILPAVLIIGIYTLIGNLTAQMQDDIEQHMAVISVQNAPEDFLAYLDEHCPEDVVSPDREEEAVRQEILRGETDIMILFPEGFEEDIRNYQFGDEVPQIKTFYNPSEEYSANVWYRYTASVLEGYRQELLEIRTGDVSSVAVFYLDSDNPDMVIQDDEKAAGKMIGTMVPYFITLMLFAGAMSLGVDMITGEKERGTLSSMLITPVKRSSIVLGKLFALMALSVMSAAVYVISMVGVLPLVLFNSIADDSDFMFSMTAGQIAELVCILAVLVFLYVALIGIVAVFAKTPKEASTYISPVYMFVIALGLISMLSSREAGLYAYAIPLYNGSIALKALFSRELGMLPFVLTVCSNLAAGLLITGIMVKGFNSEKVMFNA